MKIRLLKHDFFSLVTNEFSFEVSVIRETFDNEFDSFTTLDIPNTLSNSDFL